jgi:hypothetical protein
MNECSSVDESDSEETEFNSKLKKRSKSHRGTLIKSTADSDSGRINNLECIDFTKRRKYYEIEEDEQDDYIPLINIQKKMKLDDL